jgi:hypothetical protein
MVRQHLSSKLHDKSMFFNLFFSLTILYDLKWLVCIAFLSINHKHLSGGTPKSKSVIPIIYLLLAN